MSPKIEVRKQDLAATSRKTAEVPSLKSTQNGISLENSQKLPVLKEDETRREDDPGFQNGMKIR